MIIDFMLHKFNREELLQSKIVLAIDEVCFEELTIDEAMIALSPFIPTGMERHTRIVLDLFCT